MAFTLSFRYYLIFLLLGLPSLMLSVAAFDGECLSFYGFENESDMPGSIESFHNEGWRLDRLNSSFESGNESPSLFSITKEGPFILSFKWKISSKDYGIGLFKFQLDESPDVLCNDSRWIKKELSVPAGTHELKWSVYNGSKPFAGWIDSLCIRMESCPSSCPDIISNHAPILRKFTPNLISPQKVGASIIWTAEAYDSEDDPILYRFLLNDIPAQDWSLNRSWNWETRDFNVGDNKVEVRIRDGTHSGPEGFDDRLRMDFVLSSPNKRPTIKSFAADKEGPIDLDTPIALTIDAYDTEDDLILYKFFINGSVIRDWSSENVLTWTANQSGVSQAEAWIRDEKHAGTEDADDIKSLNITVGIPNQKPSLLNLVPNRESPQEIGTSIIWIANASDNENDTLFYKFFLNGVAAQDWSSNASWNWKTDEINPENYSVDVWIRDGKHAGPDSFDDRSSLAFLIRAHRQRLPTPVIMGPIFGYAGSEYEYSAEISESESFPNIQYEFQLDGKDYPSSQSKMTYRWDESGEKTVRVRIVDKDRDIESNWSQLVKIKIFKHRIVDSSDDEDIRGALQNYTEITLTDGEYVLNREIEIINRNNIIIKAPNNPITLRGSTFLPELISLIGCNNITIENLDISNAKIVLKINNCSDIIIINNIIRFGGCYFGIKHTSGERNILKNNQLIYDLEIDKPDTDCDRNHDGNLDLAIGMKLVNGSDIDINNNTFPIIDIYNHYLIEENYYNKNITITIPNLSVNHIIVFGNCQGLWNYLEEIDEYNGCIIPDWNNSSSIWKPYP